MSFIWLCHACEINGVHVSHNMDEGVVFSLSPLSTLTVAEPPSERATRPTTLHHILPPPESNAPSLPPSITFTSPLLVTPNCVCKPPSPSLLPLSSSSSSQVLCSVEWSQPLSSIRNYRSLVRNYKLNPFLTPHVHHGPPYQTFLPLPAPISSSTPARTRVVYSFATETLHPESGCCS